MTLLGVQWVPNGSPVLSRTATMFNSSNNDTDNYDLTLASQHDGLFPYSDIQRCGILPDGTVMNRYGDGCYSENDRSTHKVCCAPKTWYFVDTSVSGHINYFISDAPGTITKENEASGTLAVHPAFKVDGVEKDYIYPAAYHSYSDPNDSHTLKSWGGVTPTDSLDIATARVYAQQNGNGWELMTIQTWSYLQLIYLVENAHFDAQSVVGTGITGMAPPTTEHKAATTGRTPLLGRTSGSGPGFTDYDAGTSTAVSYRGWENLWGNLTTWLDGINVTPDDATPYAVWINWDNSRPFDSMAYDGTHYKLTGLSIAENVSNVAKTIDITQSNYLWTFTPTTARTDWSPTSSMCDYVVSYPFTAARAVAVGGGFLRWRLRWDV